MMLRFAKDRLYLVERDKEEEDDDEEGDDGDTAVPVKGCRVLVLSLQGDILQVVTQPTEPSARFHSICCFDRKLLATYLYYTAGTSDTRSREYGMLALHGL